GAQRTYRTQHQQRVHDYVGDRAEGHELERASQPLTGRARAGGGGADDEQAGQRGDQRQRAQQHRRGGVDDRPQEGSGRAYRRPPRVLARGRRGLGMDAGGYRGGDNGSEGGHGDRRARVPADVADRDRREGRRDTGGLGRLLRGLRRRIGLARRRP